jgi:hypothetical protein
MVKDMRMLAVAAAAVLSIGAAQGVRELAKDERGRDAVEAPYAPSPESARFTSLGYRELAADLLFFRLVGYFGGKPEASTTASLVEAIVALDPRYERIYAWGGRAMVHSINRGVGREHYLRAIAVLEIGMQHFPADYKLPQLAGEIYLLDLRTDDPAERRAWDERGSALLERSLRKPNAPAGYATYVAMIRTKLGQKQRAIDGLRELLLITDDRSAQQQILEKLAELEGGDSTEIAAEVLELRRKFIDAWGDQRPYVPASLFVLLGQRQPPGFDLGALATGGRDAPGDLAGREYDGVESAPE